MIIGIIQNLEKKQERNQLQHEEVEDLKKAWARINDIYKKEENYWRLREKCR